MNGTVTKGVQLASGFEFTEQLSSAYRLAYGHVKSPCEAISISCLDGSPNQEVLPEDRQRLSMTVCFSPDGSTMYRFEGRMYAHDLDTGMVRVVQGMPREPAFEDIRFMEVSPDNRCLLLTQTTPRKMVRGSAPFSPCRLCRLDTEGGGFQVLYEDPPDCHLDTVVCDWSRGSVLLRRFGLTSSKDRDEIWKLDLATGATTLAGKIAEIGWDLLIQPKGDLLCWSTSNEEIHLGVLGKNGITRKCVTKGTNPAWSPDGKTVAFMKDQHCLALWDAESEQVRELVWYEPSGLTHAQRRGYSYTVAPVWSPDGQMLWFALTQTRQLPRPRSLPGMMRYAYDHVYPLLHNLNPRRTSIFVGYRHHEQIFRVGIVDIRSQKVRMRNGHGSGVDWLPERPESKVAVMV